MRTACLAAIALLLAVVATADAAPVARRESALQANAMKEAIAAIVEQRLGENELYARLRRTADAAGHQIARKELAGHVTDAVTSLLQVSGDANAFSDSAGLAEPSPDCRRKLNTWMSDCVFGSPAA